jgi:hypothetical protein
VHVVLGNHEVMNLVGDLRYASPDELATYAADEDPKDRKHALRHFTQAKLADNPDLRKVHQDFERRCPRGYFGQRKAFAPEGTFGSWLLAQQIVVVINDVAFVHGGLSPLLLELEPDEINRVAMGQLRGFVQARSSGCSPELGVLPDRR